MNKKNLMVKPSFYNEIIPKVDAIALYNTRSGRMIQLSRNNMTDVIEAIQQKTRHFSLPDDKIYNTLYEMEFFIDANRDELREMQEIEDTAQFDNNLHLIILPTEECNFRCIYCYERFLRGEMTIETQDKIIEFVSRIIAKYDGLIVSWFGGEPLEGMEVIERLSKSFLEICRNAKKPYFAGMTTNGYNLTEDFVRRLKRLHVLEYQITLDGLPQQHDRQRMLIDGSGSGMRIIENLESIRDRIGSSTIRFTLRTNFTKPMLAEAGDFAEFVHEKFGNDKRFGVFWQVAEDYGYLEDPAIQADFCTEEDYYNLIRTHALKLNNATFKATIHPSATVCYALKRNAFIIGSDGSIKKCTCDMESEENLLGYVGGIFDENKHEKWLCRTIEEKSKCYYCMKRPICHFRACKKTHNCPPNLYFYKEILEELSNEQNVVTLKREDR